MPTENEREDMYPMRSPMKRLTALISAVIVLFSFLCTGIAAAETETNGGQNLMKNHDFSSRSTGWSTWSNGGGTFTYTADAGENGAAGYRITNTAKCASALFESIDFKPGHSYYMTARVRFENVSADGQGVTLGASNYSSSGENIQELVADGLHGTSDGWTDIDFLFTANEKATKVTCGVRLWFSTGTVYVDSVTCTEMDIAANGEAREFSLSLSDTANSYPILAMGCEWDPKLLLSCNRSRGVNEEDLLLIKERMKVMGLQAVRMMICPEWLEPQNDNGDPDTFREEGFVMNNDEMRSVLEQLRVCEELGIDVYLTWWGAQTQNGTGWLSFRDVSDWLSAPADIDEMAENIAYLLGWLKNKEKLTCVKGLILQNEPSYSYKVQGGAVDFDHYVRYYHAVHARLERDGLLDGLTMVGSDDAQAAGWFRQSYDALKDICGIFDSHNYSWSYDMPLLNRQAEKYVKNRVDYAPDRPFIIGEFGDGSSQGAYSAGTTETYGRGLYIASVSVNALKAGASGLSYWPLHDVYYYSGSPSDGSNGGLMSMGLIGYPKDGKTWKYRPSYYAWGLMTNYAKKGSAVYDITGENGEIIDAVAAQAPDGTWSIFCVNRSDAEQTIHVRADRIGTALTSYLFSESALPKDGNMPASSGVVSASDGVYTFTVPGWSMRVLTSAGEAYRYVPAEEVTEAVTEKDSGEVSSAESSSAEETPEEQEGGKRFPVIPLAVCAAAVAVVAGVVSFLKKKQK